MGNDLLDVTVKIEGVASSDCVIGGANEDAFVDGAQVTCSFTGLTTGSSGSKYKETINFTYTTTGGLTHGKLGVLTAKYE